MKKSFIPLVAVLLFSCTYAPAQEDKEQERERRRAQSAAEREERRIARFNEKYPEQFRDHISKEFTVAKTTSGVLAIYNLDGFIKVEGYAGDKITIEIDRTISAKDKERLEMGKSEVQLKFEQIGDSVIAYLLEPVDTRPHDWRDRGNWNNNRNIEYNCTLHYTVKVPNNLNLRISTVNNGDVDVKNVTGVLNVGNVNGAISIYNAKGTTNAHTINGDLTVTYASNPPESSSFNTLNGKLTAVFQPNLSADLQFKSMNGAFYTDFDNTQLLPAVITKNQEKRGDGTVYKLNKDTKLRVGAGGKQFKFETLNGNIYIKKQS
ncbi:hypothetical protein GWC95_13030 [Sediminibacterium roseum]|uniref:Adhesin domain-containing protein n=1 Tax=Sediminibacterium roseum TaxID=1978412 RepID=A0ABX0A0T9_9BACT|nr:hypothetical protein [Sediminibacterium roseum]NCI50855.1 hypothetical protein [Sediminibacterium roseum]